MLEGRGRTAGCEVALQGQSKNRSSPHQTDPVMYLLELSGASPPDRNKPDLKDLTIFRSRSQDLTDSGFWADARRQDTGSRLASCCVIVVANDYVRCLVPRSLHSGPPRSLVLFPPLPHRWLLSGCFVASRTPWSPGCPCQSPGFSRPRGLSAPWICGSWASDRQPLRRTRRITVESRSLSVRQGVSTPTLTPTFAGRHRLQHSQRVDILPLTDDSCEWDGACNFALGPARTSKTASPSGPPSAGIVSIVSTEGGKKSQRKQKRRSQGLYRVQELSSRRRVLTASIRCLSRHPRVPLVGREHVLVSRTSNCRTSRAGRRVSANGQCCFN